MAIQKEFLLRYLKGGHVRFQIPARVCDEAVSRILQEQISALDGVSRVYIYRGQRKLSIRFQPSICNFSALAKQLFTLLDNLEKQGALTPKSFEREKKQSFWKRKSETTSVEGSTGRWFKDKFEEAKETLQAAKVITKLGLKKPQALVKNPEKAIIDFLNDILVLYLIKLHWQDITQKWIVKPLKHRYEWMAVFYMFYLLMRARRAK
ncbi:MAG: hypothetical protein ACU84J_01700 [Gammaproteobacteria bacterium]